MKPIKLSGQCFQLRPDIKPVLEKQSGQSTLNLKQGFKILLCIRHRDALTNFSDKLGTPLLIGWQALPDTRRCPIKEFNILRQNFIDN